MTCDRLDGKWATITPYKRFKFSFKALPLSSILTSHLYKKREEQLHFSLRNQYVFKCEWKEGCSNLGTVSGPGATDLACLDAVCLIGSLLGQKTLRPSWSWLQTLQVAGITQGKSSQSTWHLSRLKCYWPVDCLSKPLWGKKKQNHSQRQLQRKYSFNHKSKFQELSEHQWSCARFYWWCSQQRSVKSL